MSKCKDVERLEDRIEALEEVIDFLTQNLEEDLDEDFLVPDELISESELVHQAYASYADHSSNVGDRQAFVSGYLARAREE